DQVDDLFLKVRSELVELVRSNQNMAEGALDLMMIAKYLERIGDHAVNVAEWVIYAITGDHMKLA
ncbi:MAG: phosphate transport system regulatory protein PhoU, partial [Ruminococcus callidus]|nr:phosphate transport system regulatory protein PhoU [Ruminococcus callidus]